MNYRANKSMKLKMNIDVGIELFAIASRQCKMHKSYFNIRVLRFCRQYKMKQAPKEY